MIKQRKKTWDQKVTLVRGSFTRSSKDPEFPGKFYQHLFFLNPEIKKYFEKTDFVHQDKALMHGMSFLLDFLDENDVSARAQVLRLATTHSSNGLKIHPHHYYYWIEALIMTARELDLGWDDDLEYYWRETLFYPISFMISQYFIQPRS